MWNIWHNTTSTSTAAQSNIFHLQLRLKWDLQGHFWKNSWVNSSYHIILLPNAHRKWKKKQKTLSLHAQTAHHKTFKVFRIRTWDMQKISKINFVWGGGKKTEVEKNKQSRCQQDKCSYLTNTFLFQRWATGERGSKFLMKKEEVRTHEGSDTVGHGNCCFSHCASECHASLKRNNKRGLECGVKLIRHSETLLWSHCRGFHVPPSLPARLALS